MSQHQSSPLRLAGTMPVMPAGAKTAPDARRRDLPGSLGATLVAEGQLTPEDLRAAREAAARGETDLLTYLRAHALVPEAEILRGLARTLGVEVADLVGRLPDPRLLDRWGIGRTLGGRVLPWRRAGGRMVVVTDDPDRFATARDGLEATFGPTAMAVAAPAAIDTAVETLRRGQMAQTAARRVAPQDSCRNWAAGPLARYLLAAAAVIAAGLVAATAWTLAALAVWAILTLALATGVRIAAAVAQLSGDGLLRGTEVPPEPPAIRPTVSILVPLFRERRIAESLVRRLERLDYPAELLDVILVLEEDDHVTRDTLSQVDLPAWMSVRTVPRGVIQTKPRALNYALDFARGSIIGIYDAEDAPDPDQITRVAARFAEAPAETACLQGVLDFYNARRNWLSRCFTIDYATWFRLILPGMARMGLVVPLGGTTLFFRRQVLEDLGAWDAHNVTEDADLGIRLARRGWRTELIATVTQEEANCRAWPWIKQRSRWLKGYAVTYAVHMRRPAKLWRDLGAWRFFGVQVLFLGALSQFALAPLLWTFWMLSAGLPHPLGDVAPMGMVHAAAGLFLAAEVANIAIGCVAVGRPGRRWLIPWVPTLTVYFVLGAVAVWKAFYEMVAKPFYWDKTAHGVDAPTAVPAPVPTATPAPKDPTTRDSVRRLLRQARIESAKKTAL